MKYFNVYSFICCLFLTLTFTGQTITVQNLDDSGTGSLRDAINTANSGDTIRFNPMLIAQGSDTLVLDTVINIDKDLVIKGLYDDEDTLFLSSLENRRMFHFDTVDYILLDSLCLIADTISYNSNYTISFVYSDVVVSNSFFKGYKTTLLYAWQSSLNIYGCSFYNDINTNASIVFLSNGDELRTLSIISSFLQNNKTGYNFDIRLTGNKNNNKIIFEDSYFKDSKSWFFGHLSTDITYCTFENSPLSFGHESFGGGTLERDMTLLCFGSTFLISSIDYRQSPFSCIGTPTSPFDPPPSDFFELQFNNCTFNGGVYVDTAYGNNYDSNYLDYFGPDLDELKITSCIFNDINGFNELPIDSSGGYNLFSFPQSIGLDSTDQADVLVSDINLGPLQNNGGFTPTHVPNYESLAFNSGNPNDTSSAQNGAIIQRRDIGAAEIQATLTIDTTEYCGESYQWRDTTLTESDIHFDIQESTTGGYDSVFVLDLTLDYIDAIAISDGGELKANISDVTYQWIDCSTNQPLFGETNQTFSPTVAGNYAVVISNTICTDTSSCVYINNIGLKELEKQFVFVKGNVLYFNGVRTIETDYVIYNSLGQKMLYSNTSQEQQQDLSYLESGVYFLEFRNENISPIKFVLD